jgi:hypothetical protein
MKRKHFFLWLLLFACVVLAEAQTVYITRTGRKYHREECRYLRYSSYAISLSEAINRDYGACLVCRPPVKETPAPLPEKTSLPSEERFREEKNTEEKSNEEKSREEKFKEEKFKEEKYREEKVTASSQCSASTKSGARCKRRTSNPNGRCWQHP